MKTKSAKRSLAVSILCFVLCVAMLVGATYAWFTDSVTSGKNQIMAGNLDIEVEYSKDMGTWKTVQGTTDLFKDVNLWEPGAADVVYLRISNKGTLALKYNLGINIDSEVAGTNVNGDTFKLSDYIKFGQVEDVAAKYSDRATAVAAVSDSAANINAGYTVSGSITAGADPKVIALVVYMPETVGNDANYKTGTEAPTIEMGISVQATQLSSESDSFDNTYDLGTAWMGGTDDEGLTANTDTSAKTVKIESAEQLASFAKAVNAGNTYAGYTVTLAKDIDLNNMPWTPISGFNGTFDGQQHTVSNFNVSGEKAVGLFGDVVGATIKNVTVSNANVTGVAYVGAVVGKIYGHVSGCSVTNSTVTAVKDSDGNDGAKAGAIVGYLCEDYGDSVKDCSVSNTTIAGIRDLGAIVGCVNKSNIVTGNTATNVTINQRDTTGYTDGDTTTLGAIYGRVVDHASTGELQENTSTGVTINLWT